MHLTLSLQYPYSQVYFTELNSCKRSHKFAVNKNNCALHVLSERGPCSLLNVKWWWRDVSARRKKRKRKDIYSQEKRPASGLSWIWTLAPPCNYHQTTDCALKEERTGLDPPQPLSSPSYWAQTLHIWESSSKGPSDNYTRQPDTRSRGL